MRWVAWIPGRVTRVRDRGNSVPMRDVGFPAEFRMKRGSPMIRNGMANKYHRAGIMNRIYGGRRFKESIDIPV
jgi:hypothetical protein